jgi:hypothetical protein
VLRIGRLVENYFDRHALHYLDIIARGILSGKQAKARAGACLYAVDMALESLVGKGINC